MKDLARAANPDEALVALDGFLAGLPSGVQIFSLFEANPTLVELIIDIAGTSPALARHLSRNAAVLDAVIGGSFWAPWPGVAGLVADLARAAGARRRDYEARLDTARRWMKEWHFRVGVHHLRGLIDAFEAGQKLCRSGRGGDRRRCGRWCWRNSPAGMGRRRGAGRCCWAWARWGRGG